MYLFEGACKNAQIAGNEERLQCQIRYDIRVIFAALTDPESVRRYLHGVGQPSRAPPVSPALLGKQLELDDAA